MPRRSADKRANRAGTYYRRRGHWYVQVTGIDGTRSRPIKFPGDWSEEQIAKKTETLAALAQDATRSTAGSMRDTVSTWFSRWFEERTSRGIVTAKLERGRFTKWVPAELAAKLMVEVTKGDLEDFVERLDRAALAHAAAEAAGEKVDHAAMMSWKSAINVWTIAKTGFDDAHNAKTRSLRVLDRNPAAEVHGPDKGAVKARSSLSPTKLLAFVGRDDVPILWRRVVAIAAYTYLRASELRGLRWADVRFGDGYILVHHTVDREGEDGTTKSEKPRQVPIEAALLPLLRQLAKGKEPHELVIEIPDDRHLARALRTWLRYAGLDGPELQRSATQAALTYHDAGRATGITWRAIRRDDHLRIMVDAGHADFETTLKYVRTADMLRAGYGDVFPELPDALLSEPLTGAPAGDASTRNHWRKYGGGAGNRTLVREASNATSFTCVVAVSPATELADSAATYLSLSRPRYRERSRVIQPS